MLILLFACSSGHEGGGTTEDGPAPSGDGTLGWADLAALIPACEPLQAGSDLDFEAVCVWGACKGDPLDTFTAELGPTDGCDGVECSWDGLYVDFDADSKAGGLADDIQVTDAAWGRDANGLGVGAGLGCFVDVYGEPDSITFSHDDDGWMIWWLDWDSPDLDVFNHEVGGWVADNLIFG
jgi:hypothetical protein